jgi:hypothetical protein
MLVPETDDGCRAIICALWSLDEGEGVSFIPFLSQRIDACA